MAITNVELWNKLRDIEPTFRNHTAKGTSDLFTAAGFEALAATDLDAINEFFSISMRVALQKISTSRAKNIFTDSGIVEVYDTPNGGFTQRIAIGELKPETPVYSKLTDGKSVDPWIVRKPTVSERFFKKNFDYYSHVTVQMERMKEIFIAQYGMDEFMNGIMTALQSGFVTQEMQNTLEVINTAINSTKTPLQDTQKLYTTISDEKTAEELVALIGTVTDCVYAMTLQSSTDAFNAGKFKTAVNADDLVLLLRAPYVSAIQRKLMASAFHREDLNMPVSVKPVIDFGGIEYYSDETYKTKLYPYYDQFGSVDGYSLNDPAAGAQEKYDGNVYAKDPNESIIAVLIQKGAIFENVQNPYSVRPIINPAGLYTNYHAVRPFNTIAYDSFYNMVTIAKSN